MKGLLYKDFCLMKKHCRAYLFVVVFILFAAIMEEDGLFMLLYPCILVGMMPVTLLGYDERSGWDRYSTMLPYTKAQLVSAKYIVGLIMQALVMALTAAAQLCRVLRFGDAGVPLGVVMAMMITASFVSVGLCMPFMFKFGVEKGRMAYYLMIGMACGACAAASMHSSGGVSAVGVPAAPIWIAAAALATAIYGVSWYISIQWYKKREI